ncbi:Male-specific lethal 2 like protein [Melipona quadrifasciata]|uniref:Male-specific lethal 2 like protein n=1 Tax=Melipona quadrifasciata TaxID=166423 RepID=A0A0N0BHC3_9HYME|nr:Male-specific lethal 2 like protein [Melipona quadrifasciata]
MNATSLYVSTCRLVLQADADDPNSWTDLYRLVPYLRQSLSCTVCSNLLIEPHTPTETNCQHHVCRGCRGGRKKLKPSCVSSNKAGNNASAIGASSLMELIQEGSGFKDEFKSTAGLSKSAYSILPCVYTSTTSTQTQGNTIQNSEAVSQSISDSPAIRTVSNGSSIYSVMYAGSGNKITIKRKAAAADDTEVGHQDMDGSPHSSVGGLKVKNLFHFKQSSAFKKPRSNSARSKRKGCRCGNATAIPGKLTCCGQRCPCYVESKPCVECRCRGCRNPHTADGLKIRPHIPELHNLQLQLSTSLDCDALNSDPLGSVSQCLSTSPTTIQVLNVYSTPRLDIDNVPQNLPAALLVGEDAMISTESEAEDSDIQIDV